MTDIFKLQLQQPQENMGGKDNLTSIFNGFFIDWDFRGDCGGDTTPATCVTYPPGRPGKEHRSGKELGGGCAAAGRRWLHGV